MISFAFITLSVLLSSMVASVSANNWAGANSYLLHTLADSDRIVILDQLQQADIKAIRVFVNQVYAGSKGTSASAVNDIETNAVGQYDDTVLGMIDNLAAEAHARDMKLIIALHDRYSLGCWMNDGYVWKYNLPTTESSGCYEVPDSSIFYTDAGAQADFDARINHILDYQSPNFNKPWYEMSEAILAFEVQNESQGHMNLANADWMCDRAETIHNKVGTWGSLISTGGGVDFPTSTLINYFQCPYIDIVALHDYNIDPDYIVSNINSAKPTSLTYNKKLFYEEFGAMGDSKQSDVQSVMDVAVEFGIPWSYWEAINPGQGPNNYEVWTNEGSWAVLQYAAINTATQAGEYYWSPIDTYQS